LTINDQVLAAMGLYGLPVLSSLIFLTSFGIPLPATFALIAAGSFVELGSMNLWWVVVMAAFAAVIGDQLAYALGRWGGHRLTTRLTGWFGGAKQLDQAENAVHRWGWAGIFFSRWLVTPLSPWINYTSGISGYSYRRFLLWDVTGELLWVTLYVVAGELFSDRVQALIETLGSLAWVEIGLIAAAIFGWLLYRNLRNSHK
jgi:membrane protein DedA with SNARE-associated domain